MSANSEEMSRQNRAQVPAVIIKTLYFLRHFLEMCIVMCASATILSLLLRKGAALTGNLDPIQQYPEVSVSALAVFLTLIMYAWMRFRGHDLRSTLEMASTSVLALIPLFVMDWLSIVPKSELYALECGLACVLMLAPMLFRLDHYTGRHVGHHQSAQAGHPIEAHSHHMG